MADLHRFSPISIHGHVISVAHTGCDPDRPYEVTALTAASWHGNGSLVVACEIDCGRALCEHQLDYRVDADHVAETVREIIATLGRKADA